jgi:RNA polymerase sigma factor (sigma-70 family)
MAEKTSAPFRATVAVFPPTMWHLVREASHSSGSSNAQEALGALFRLYWGPLYAFLLREGKSAHDAEDLLQGFFLHLLEKEKLAKVSEERGRFRTFLLTSLRNYVRDVWAHGQAKRRGEGKVFLTADTRILESFQDMNEPPERVFDRRCALELIRQTMDLLAGEYSATAAKQARFERIKTYLLGDGASGSYGTAAAELGLTEGAFKVAVLRMRQRFRELFRLEVGRTVSNEAELEEEIRYLISVAGKET